MCDKVSRVADWAEDHNPYLISQAVNELRPELIWQRRNYAVHYRPRLASCG